MKRKMLFFEQFMYIDGVTPINCVMTAQVQGHILAENLRIALDKVQAKHPLLRNRIVDEAGEPHFVFDPNIPAIAIRQVERQSDQHWHQITASEWLTPFDPATGPLLRIVWLRSEHLSEIMLVAHHCICDGGSITTLMREILQLTDQPSTQLTPYTPYNSLKDLLSETLLTDPATLRRIKRKATLYKIFLSLLSRKAAPPPSNNQPYVIYWQASTERFALVLRRCKAEKTTPYAALCVAYLQAFRDLQGKAARNKIMCPVNIRRFLPAIKDDMLFAFAPTVELSLSKTPASAFWHSARQIKHSIAEQIENKNIGEDLMLGDLMRPSVPNIVNFLKSRRGGHDLAFSNIGALQIPAQYQSFNVTSIPGASVAIPWKNTNTLVMTSFEGVLNLNFMSNEGFLPQHQARDIHHRAMHIFFEAMAQPPSNTRAEP